MGRSASVADAIQALGAAILLLENEIEGACADNLKQCRISRNNCIENDMEPIKCLSRENCKNGTPIVALRIFAISNIDVIKLGLQTSVS